MLIDTHCHLDEIDNIDEIINEINEEKIIIIVSGYDIKSSNQAISLANKYNNVYATVGFHPHECNNIKEEHYNLFDKWFANPKVVGLGEIGLDYYYDLDYKDKQILMFERQINIAIKYNKPIVIHNREASEDIYNILNKYNIKGILHCFNDDLEYASKFIDLGLLLGIGGIVTFKNNKLAEILKDISVDNIVFETDSPYLAPTPFRGKKNTPLYLPYIIKEVSKIKDIEYDILISRTTNNAVRVFDLKL